MASKTAENGEKFSQNILISPFLGEFFLGCKSLFWVCMQDFNVVLWLKKGVIYSWILKFMYGQNSKKNTSKVALETPSACKFFDQNDRWVKNFQWEQWQQDLRCGQVMAAKTVENGYKLSKNSDFRGEFFWLLLMKF